MVKSVTRHPVAVAVALSALVTLALALNVSPWLRGGAGWRWPYAVPADPLRLLPGALALVIYLALAMAWLDRLEQSEAGPGDALFALFCGLGGVALQLAFLAFHDSNPLRALFMRTVSTSSGGFFEVGVRVERPLDFLRAFPDLMPTLSVHPKAHPPGIPLLFWASERLFGLLGPLADALARGLRPYQCQQTVIMALPDEGIAAAALGMVLPGLSMLALWPLYKLGHLLYDRRTSLLALTWWPLVPALVMFVPQWNQLHPLFALLALWALTVGLRGGKWWHFAISGAVMSLATFLSFTNVAILGLLGVYGVACVALAAKHSEWSGGRWRLLARGGVALLLGLASLWLAYYLVAGVSFFEVLRVSLGTHYDLGHPYLPWILLLPLDFWLFGGLVLGVLAAVQSARGWRSDDPLALALGVGMVGLALSGVLRGEVGRLLLWMMPVSVLVAAHVVAARQQSRRAAWAVSAALGVQLVVMVAFLRVMDTELSLPPGGPPPGAEAAASHPTQATFDGTADLIAFDGQVIPGESALDLTLTWRPRGHFDHPHYMGAIVLGPAGDTLGVKDWLAGGEAYPATCWRPGEVVTDRVRVPLEATPPGDYWLSLRMFDSETGEPLPVSVPGLPDDTQVGLGPVSMP